MKLDAAIEYSIQRSTTKDLKPLKPKHIQNITMATAQRDVQMSDLFRCFGGRLKESSSIVTLKTLLLIHIMIREGSHERVLGYLASNPGLVDVYHLKDKYDQLRNVQEYSEFLEERVAAFKNVKEDFVKGKAAMITYYKHEPLDEQKLKSIQSLQLLIEAGAKCSCFVDDWRSDNPIQIQAFRLIVGDMIGLFHLLNEAVLRLLAGFFELEKPLAKLGLEIYKNFADQTKRVTGFFEQAGRVSVEIGVRIPVFKQAPASLVSTLSDHIKAPNFEEQRVIAREQKAMKALAGKKSKKNKSNKDLSRSGSASSLDSQTELEKSSAPATAGAENDLRKKIALKADPVLIDFFASIDEEVQAFESDANQAQYGDVGSVWYPQQFGQDQGNGNSPLGSMYGLTETAKTQAQIQKQLQQTEQMFASAGFSIQPAGLGYPAPSNQSSFNGLPEGAKMAPNPFMPPSQNFANSSSAQPFSSAGSTNMQSQPFRGHQSSPLGTSQAPFGNSLNYGSQQQVVSNQPAVFQTQPFGAPTVSLSNTYMNPFAFSQAQSNTAPLNPFGTSSNSNQPVNLNFKMGAFIPTQAPTQPSTYSSLPRSNTAQPMVPPKNVDLFGDLASLDLSYTTHAQNKIPSQPQPSYTQFGAFGGNVSGQFPGLQADRNLQSQPPVSFPPFGAGQSGGQSMNDPFNPFGTAQKAYSPPVAAANPQASNPFGNLDFGGNLSGGSSTASNSYGNYIVSSSSNAQPQTLFDPRSNANGTASDPFTRPSQNQDLFAHDPFSMPLQNSTNGFGFQKK